MIDATTGGGALMQYNAMMQNVGEEKVRNSIADSDQAMRDWSSP